MTKSDHLQQRALIFPALTEKSQDRNIYFLLSATQVEEVIDNRPVCRVPFSHPYTEGIATWREQLLPVINLEKCIGLESNTVGKRMLVVRTGDSRNVRPDGLKGILRISVGIRNVTIPLPCTTVQPDDRIKNIYMIKGMFEWEDGLLIIPDIQKIINGNTEIGSA